MYDKHFLWLSGKLVNKWLICLLVPNCPSLLLFFLAKAWDALASGKCIWQDNFQNCFAAYKVEVSTLALAASGDGLVPCREPCCHQHALEFTFTL